MTRLHEIVLQYNVLYCGWKGGAGGKIVLQYKNCIATEGLGCWAQQALGAQGAGRAGAGMLQADRRAARAERAGGRAWARGRGA